MPDAASTSSANAESANAPVRNELEPTAVWAIAPPTVRAPGAAKVTGAKPRGNNVAASRAMVQRPWTNAVREATSTLTTPVSAAVSSNGATAAKSWTPGLGSAGSPRRTVAEPAAYSDETSSPTADV